MTPAQQRAKVARALAALEKAAALLDEVYRENKDSTYRLDENGKERHYEVAKAASAAEVAVLRAKEIRA